MLWPKVRLIPADVSTPMNKDYFHNMKAQAWWALRQRFYKTFRAVTEGIKYDVSELICLPSDLPFLQKLMKELCQVVLKSSGRNLMLVDKAPGSLKSPNLADALVMAFFPIVSMYNYDSSMKWVD